MAAERWAQAVLKRAVIALVIALSFGAACSPPPAPPPPAPTTTTRPPLPPACSFPAANTAMVRQLIDLHNQARAERGAAPLTHECNAAVYAQQRAENLRSRFGSECGADHVGWDPSRLGGTSKGENAGCIVSFPCDHTTITPNQRGNLTSPQTMFAWWRVSTHGHWEAIINPRYRNFGVGIACGPGGTVYAMVEFWS